MKRLAVRIRDAHGVTDSSLLLWRMTRRLFGDLREAECGDLDPHSPDLTCDLDLLVPGTAIDIEYGLVLRDDRRQELWLSGCGAGYGGEGPGGTKTILEAEGFSAAHVALVEVYSAFHIRKDRDEPLFVGDARFFGG